MAASLPGASLAENQANPSQGRCVMLDPLSGPQGSPFGGRTLSFDAAGHPVYAADTADLSTGALSTGIGFGSPPIIGPTAPGSIQAAGFTDAYSPGMTKPDGTPSSDATHVYIGGGRSDVDGVSNPYAAGYALGMAGNGASRDGGTGPAFTAFACTMATATGTVANGADVETGLTNRSGVTLSAGQSVFSSNDTPNVAPTLVE